MSDPVDRNEAEAQKARRDLERIAEQSDTIGSSALARMAKSTGDRFSAKDVNQDDKIEVWGARIGRGLGLLFAIGLAIHLIFTYVLN
ncbi:MAG: hypothetical protein AAGE89_15120 [Pseudomonadota bacterium]